jgi:hypothetical protein
VIAGAALAVLLIMSGQVAMGHDYGGEGLRRADASTLDVGLVSAAGDFQARAAAVMTRYGQRQASGRAVRRRVSCAPLRVH